MVVSNFLMQLFTVILQVVRSADDVTTTIGMQIPPDLCFQVVLPFLNGEHLNTIQAAIKMLTSAIGRARKDQLSEKVVNDIVPSLIKVRKNQFCRLARLQSAMKS